MIIHHAHYTSRFVYKITTVVRKYSVGKRIEYSEVMTADGTPDLMSRINDLRLVQQQMQQQQQQQQQQMLASPAELLQQQRQQMQFAAQGTLVSTPELLGLRDHSLATRDMVEKCLTGQAVLQAQIHQILAFMAGAGAVSDGRTPGTMPGPPPQPDDRVGTHYDRRDGMLLSYPN
jgi:hypothetical protein